MTIIILEFLQGRFGWPCIWKDLHLVPSSNTVTLPCPLTALLDPRQPHDLPLPHPLNHITHLDKGVVATVNVGKDAVLIAQTAKAGLLARRAVRPQAAPNACQPGRCEPSGNVTSSHTRTHIQNTTHQSRTRRAALPLALCSMVGSLARP